VEDARMNERTMLKWILNKCDERLGAFECSNANASYFKIEDFYDELSDS
jgi:hypothetical protein